MLAHCKLLLHPGAHLQGLHRAKEPWSFPGRGSPKLDDRKEEAGAGSGSAKLDDAKEEAGADRGSPKLGDTKEEAGAGKGSPKHGWKGGRGSTILGDAKQEARAGSGSPKLGEGKEAGAPQSWMMERWRQGLTGAHQSWIMQRRRPPRILSACDWQTLWSSLSWRTPSLVISSSQEMHPFI